MEIRKEIWGRTPAGQEITLFTITNSKGASVSLSSLGAGIVSIVVPDREGKMTDVVLGYPEAMSYMADGPCFGKVPGRFANRIALGKFSLDGKEYNLPINNGPNALHGGPEGFQNRVWECREAEGGVEFLYYSEDGEMGYPGALKAVVRYQWDEENTLELTMTAECDAPTVVNLTNHVYFNLKGEGEGDVLDHDLTINASEYLATDPTQIPLGESVPVAGTPMDFVNPKKIGAEIKADFEALKIGKGYDHCWVIDGYQPGQIQRAACLSSEISGICVDVLTTQPGIQVYTGNWLSGCPQGKKGHVYHDYDGVALECQHYPDSPNKPEYPTTVLRPGEQYQEAIIFAFSVKE